MESDDEPFFLEESDGDGHDDHEIVENKDLDDEEPFFLEESDGDGHEKCDSDGETEEQESEYCFFYGHKEGPYAFLSNFFISTFFDEDKKQHFWSVEQYMHYHKARLFNDTSVAEAIYHTKSPAVAKKLGRTVKGFEERKWVLFREMIVTNGLRLKFANPDLRKRLLATGKAVLVEAAPRDRIWGIGFSKEKALDNKHKWGLNLLGKCLMKTRALVSN
jgi:ribA/ribD-fused uncharacterized protein